jgi:hypothetical protein
LRHHKDTKSPDVVIVNTLKQIQRNGEPNNKTQMENDRERREWKGELDTR